MNEKAELKKAVEKLMECPAEFIREHRVIETYQGKAVWDGQVATFKLDGHQNASQCFAWSLPGECTKGRRYYAVLCAPPVDTPSAAIRAAIVSEYRKQ